MAKTYKLMQIFMFESDLKFEEVIEYQWCCVCGHNAISENVKSRLSIVLH